MNSKTKLLMALSAALAVILIILVKSDKSMTTDDKKSVADESRAELAPVEKTSNVDAVAAGIVADYAADASIAAEGDADIDYVNQSAELINPEGVYNANDF